MSRREILFRGKRIDNGEWVEGYFVEYPSGKTEIHKKCVEPPDILLVVEVDSETVCRYTGLTDKNGRKIFERDIVRIVNTDRENQVFDIGQISFEEGAWFLCGEMLCWFDNVISFEIEVIGNIFDNPELIN